MQRNNRISFGNVWNVIFRKMNGINYIWSENDSLNDKLNFAGK